MPHARLSNEEIDRRGLDIYKNIIQAKVETPENIGKQIVIDVETGTFEIDQDGLKASRRILKSNPGAAFFGLRIGYNAVYTIGGVLTRTAKPC